MIEMVGLSPPPVHVCQSLSGVIPSDFFCFFMRPLMLSVQEVADVLGISKTSAYVLSKEKGFPTLKIGSRVVIPRDKFIKWINTNTK